MWATDGEKQMWQITRINYTHEYMLINPKGFSEGIYSTLVEALRAKKIFKNNS